MDDYHFGAIVGWVSGASATLFLLFATSAISFEEFIIPMVIMNLGVAGLFIIKDAIRNKNSKHRKVKIE